MEKTIGDITRKYREKHRISLRRFAELCGVSKTYLYQLECGKTGKGDYPSPSLSVVMAIADAMKMNPMKLFREIGFSIDSQREQKSAGDALIPVTIKPYEYIPVTMENLKAAAQRNSIMILPFSLPVLGGFVYIPEFKRDGHVVTHRVTEIQGGIYSAVSEQYGTVVFNLFDIDRSVFTERDAAYDALEKWLSRHLDSHSRFIDESAEPADDENGAP
ncbi:MAG: helix-turn-helix transcriptional regulator [Oscillospiraceae bacterium]|nr:helix-turn-helix transcriptional regulator [Oscillospiraceae bacterium]